MVGFSDRDCSFAILMDTGWNSPRKLEQQNGLAAYSKTAEHFRLVTNAYLPEFDTCAVNGRKILYQLSEIDPAV